ncbi:MAG: hypothetical protein HQ472_08535 [Ignavibacteria bacterium]|nr:hypothetical protein [Ignavibacteria bacterium]
MAYIGHSVRILLHSSNVAEFESEWHQLGFETQASTGDPEMDYVRLTDGQIIVSCKKGAEQAPCLVYFHSDVSGLHHQLESKKIEHEYTADSRIQCAMPGGMRLIVHQQSIDDQVLPTKFQNSLLGYADTLIVYVESIADAQSWAENVGYFVQEHHRGTVERLDMFDGLFTLSFRAATSKRYHLSYVTFFDNDMVEDLTSVAPHGVTVRRYSDESVMYVEIPMTGGLSVLVSPDDD